MSKDIRAYRIDDWQAIFGLHWHAAACTQRHQPGCKIQTDSHIVVPLHRLGVGDLEECLQAMPKSYSFCTARDHWQCRITQQPSAC